jgi:hypothetical protein
MFMKKMTIIAGLAVVFAGCYNDKYDKLYPAPTATTCDTTTISYATDIMPILNTYCNTSSGCHGASSTTGYDFTTYMGIRGVANTEILINDIKGTPTGGRSAMPKNMAKMPDCNINKITRWVNQGAINN